jgi:hypothetical protein
MFARFIFFVFFVLDLAPSKGLAALHQQLSTALMGTEFDFIIVGGAQPHCLL